MTQQGPGSEASAPFAVSERLARSVEPFGQTWVHEQTQPGEAGRQAEEPSARFGRRPAHGIQPRVRP